MGDFVRQRYGHYLEWSPRQKLRRALGALKLKASIAVLDLARSHPFAPNEPIASRP